LLTAALDGSLRNVEFRTDKYFGFAVPAAPGVPSEILNPVAPGRTRGVRQDRALVGMFRELCQVRNAGRADVRAAAPEVARGG
jgi:phosphoenolpyruvate carboxykinase (ATP)